MPSHRFQIGDDVELVRLFSSPREVQGCYTVTRLLPNDSPDREYRVRFGRDGQERVVRESEMRLVPARAVGLNPTAA